MLLLVRGVMLAALAMCVATFAQNPKPVMSKVADGIYLFRTADYENIFVDGNAIAIASDNGVLVFDSNMIPGTTRMVLAEIRKLTDKPVKYVVNSHWHWDHWLGNGVYTEAFPNVQIIAHEETRKDILLRGPMHVKFWNDEFIPKKLAEIEKNIADAKAKGGAKQTARWEQALQDGRYFQEEYRNAKIVPPNVTFKNELSLHLGSREIQILHYKRGNTPGDAFLYLPKEKILITGDLLVHPAPYCFGVFPTEWIETLERMNQLDAKIVVPGHGPVLQGKEYLQDVLNLFKTTHEQLRESKKKGLTLEEARKALKLEAEIQKFTHGDPALMEEFDADFIQPFPRFVYEELDGRRQDRPAVLKPF